MAGFLFAFGLTLFANLTDFQALAQREWCAQLAFIGIREGRAEFRQAFFDAAQKFGFPFSQTLFAQLRLICRPFQG